MPIADPDGPEVIEPRVKAERSLTTLLSDLASETVELLRQELGLLKAELQEKASKAGVGAAAGAGAGYLTTPQRPSYGYGNRSY